MKLDAQIEFVVDDEQLGIHAGQKANVPVDADYTDADPDEVIYAVEQRLWRDYNHIMFASRSPSDNGDFVIKNLDDVVSDLAKMHPDVEC